MGFGKKFKSLFIVDEEEESEQNKKSEQDTRAASAPQTPPSAPNTQPAQRQVQPQPQQPAEPQKKAERNYFQPEQPAKLSMKIGKGEASSPSKPQSETTTDNEPQSGNVKKAILKMISDVIDEHNIPGNDYYELNKIIESQGFINAIPDKTARTVSAFYSLKAQDPKVSKQSILNSIDFYKDVVNKEYQNVLASYNATVEAQVNAPRKEIDKLLAQKQELLEKIASIDKQVAVLQQEITDKTLELNSKKADYDASFELVLKNLNDEKTELNNILQ